MLCWITRKSNKNTADQQLEEHLRKTIQYYFEVLKRVVAVIKLSEKGLAFRGHEEKWGSPNNGNFMEAIELIAEFNPFLHEYLKKCKNEKVNATYLSKPVYEELIEIMRKHVQDDIVNQINNLDTKYYFIIVDSTPDLTHVDQLVIVVRCCSNGKPCERFLSFLPIENHSSTTLFNKIQQILGEHKLSLENIRGQSYDNASNMKGSEKGLQALFKNINRYADYVPCAAHSLNLVGEKAVSTVPDVVDYFGILQGLYVFFSGSPRRWGFLNTQGNLHFSLKSLSVTRWSAHYEAIRAIKNGYMGILQTLKHIFKDSEENPECKRDAKNLYHKLVKLGYAILTVVWEEVLERFNKTSKKLQTPGFAVFEGYLLLSSLLSFVKELRENSADCTP
ncbi:hypothetical protein scyTo_0000329 [Scyliorhinus torazame]|uniref:DUF4371 domain-containing protein n=1 Tax=Scyliorhinus torazame TaxID=75743 RepID=A0A401NVB0_SCYTO|nr:hypothetical protein [Scyliorhinus torazame]